MASARSAPRPPMVARRARAGTRARRCADAGSGGSWARAHQTCTTGYMCACICVYVAVHAHVCVRMRACAECVPACASACACTRVRAERRAAQGGDLHLGSAVHMHIVICTRARMYTCMRVLVDCISARVGVGVDAGACGGGSGRPLIVCHFVPLYRCIPIYECRYVLLYTCMLVYVCVCV